MIRNGGPLRLRAHCIRSWNGRQRTKLSPDEASQPAGRASLLFGVLCSTVERILPRKETILQITKVSGVGPTAVLGIDVRCVAVGRGMILRRVTVKVGNPGHMKRVNSRGGASRTRCWYAYLLGPLMRLPVLVLLSKAWWCWCWCCRHWHNNIVQAPRLSIGRFLRMLQGGGGIVCDTRHCPLHD